MWSLSDNPNFRWFCDSAYLVDEFQPITVSGVTSIAFATHLPPLLEPLEPSSGCPDGDDDLLVQFRTLESDDNSPSLWRCDVGWTRYPRRRFAIAGSYDDELLTELRRATFLLLIDAAVWDWWDRGNVHLVVPNDQELWSQCGT
jgi:hypothetical protein